MVEPAGNIARELNKLKISPNSSPAKSCTAPHVPQSRFFTSHPKRTPQKLVSLCLGILGQHLEEIIMEIPEIADELPADIKLALLAIARRRQLLNDVVLAALVEPGWEILDLSGSDVTDAGLAAAAKICTNLRAVDISRCDSLSIAGVSEIIGKCCSLHTLRCGGSSRSDSTARRVVSLLKPELNALEEESWEELDDMDIGSGAPSLRWLVWPKIDEDSKAVLAAECSRITVNPRASLFGPLQVPDEALADLPLDHRVVEGIDPKTWAFSAAPQRCAGPPTSTSSPSSCKQQDLPIAEKFRLAYVEREARLAPKRAKRERQNQRRAKREFLKANIGARSVALAAEASKHIRKG